MLPINSTNVSLWFGYSTDIQLYAGRLYMLALTLHCSRNFGNQDNNVPHVCGAVGPTAFNLAAGQSAIFVSAYKLC